MYNCDIALSSMLISFFDLRLTMGRVDNKDT